MPLKKGGRALFSRIRLPRLTRLSPSGLRGIGRSSNPARDLKTEYGCLYPSQFFIRVIAAGLASNSRLLESGGEVSDEVFAIFDAHRITDQVVLDADHQALFGGELVEAHERRLLDQAFNPPQ